MFENDTGYVSWLFESEHSTWRKRLEGLGLFEVILIQGGPHFGKYLARYWPFSSNDYVIISRKKRIEKALFDCELFYINTIKK